MDAASEVLCMLGTVCKSFTNPLMYDPNMSEHGKTTLVQFANGHWEETEVCEKIWQEEWHHDPH